MSLPLVATCVLGLEDLLADELRGLGVSDVAPQRGAVAFRGGWPDVWRANLRLRTANRVLVVLDRWPVPDDAALAAGMRALVTRRGAASWDGVRAAALFAPERTFAIRATSGRSQLTDVRWVALRAKDGLVDGQRARFGRRSSVDRESPELPLRLWLFEDRATLLLDTSGAPLDRRGYRVRSVRAPVREQLAAACVLAAGWDGRGPVLDPMCGSGTLLIEAALIALGRAPGASRRRWVFEGLPGFEPEAWQRIRQEPLPNTDPDLELFGIDRDPSAVAATRANMDRANLSARAIVDRGDAFSMFPPAASGLLLINPAYGERLAESPEQWRRLGDWLKQHYSGWTAVVLAGGESKGKHIGLRTSRKIPIKNGPLDARILVFQLY